MEREPPRKKSKPSSSKQQSQFDNDTMQIDDTAELDAAIDLSETKMIIDQNYERDEEKVISNFKAWIKEHGVQHDKVEMKEGDFGWGLSATDDIEENEILVSVPAKLAISIHTVRNSIIGTLVRRFNKSVAISRDIKHENQNKNGNEIQFTQCASAGSCIVNEQVYCPCPFLSDRLALLLFLITEKHGVASFWSAHLRAIPEAYSTPFWWSKKELSYLEGTNLGNAVAHQKTQFFSMLKKIATFCKSKVFSQLSNAAELASIFTFSNLLWANSAYTSRGFPSKLIDEHHRVLYASSVHHPKEEEKEESTVDSPLGVLIPYLGLTNHRYKQKITWIAADGAKDDIKSQKDGDNMTKLYSNSKPDCVTFIAGSPVAKGEPIWNNYGPKGNEELLLGYGFCLPENPHDTVTVALNAQSIMNNNPWQYAWMKRLGLLDQTGLSTHSLRFDHVPDSLKWAVRLTQLNATECQYLELRADQLLQESERFEEGLHVSPRNELAMYQLLISLLQNKVKQIPSSAPDDKHMLNTNQGRDGKILSPFSRLAIIYRSGQRAVLHSCLAKLTAINSANCAQLTRDAHEQQQQVIAATKDVENKSGRYSPPQSYVQSVKKDWIQTKQWIEEHGGVINIDLQLNDNSTGSEWTWLLNTDCKRNEPIVSVPTQLLLSPSVCASTEYSSFGAKLMPLLQSMGPEQLLIIFLLWERKLGQDSFWSPFLQSSCVKGFEGMLAWSETETGSFLLSNDSSIKAEVEYAKEDLDYLSDVLKAPNFEAVRALFESPEHYSTSSIRWAAAVLEKYRVTLPHQKGLGLQDSDYILPVPVMPRNQTSSAIGMMSSQGGKVLSFSCSTELSTGMEIGLNLEDSFHDLMLRRFTSSSIDQLPAYFSANELYSFLAEKNIVVDPQMLANDYQIDIQQIPVFYLQPIAQTQTDLRKSASNLIPFQLFVILYVSLTMQAERASVDDLSSDFLSPLSDQFHEPLPNENKQVQATLTLFRQFLASQIKEIQFSIERGELLELCDTQSREKLLFLTPETDIVQAHRTQFRKQYLHHQKAILSSILERLKQE